MHKKYPRSFIQLRLNHWSHMDYFNNILTTFWALNMVDALLSMQGPWFPQKYLNMCFKDERRTYGFGTTWIKFFWVNYPFNQPRYQHKNSLIWKWNNNFPFFSSLDCSVWAFERLVSKATSLKDSLRYKLQCKHFRHLEGKTDDLYALICCALPVPSVLPSWAIILPPSLTHLTPTIWLAFIDYDTKAPGSTYKWTRH